jgi:hypothetical protein
MPESVFTQTMPLLFAGGACGEVEVLGTAVFGAGAGVGAGVEVELEAGVVAVELAELVAGADGGSFFAAVFAWVAPLGSEVE